MTSFILLALFTIAEQQIAPAAPVTARESNRSLFSGRTNFGFTPNTKKRTLIGRDANEVIYGNNRSASSEGAAGSIVESISKLVCTIDPNEIMKKVGGGQLGPEAGPRGRLCFLDVPDIASRVFSPNCTGSCLRSVLARWADGLLAHGVLLS